MRNLVEGEGFEPSKLSRQIYSLIPLTAREPLRKRAPFSSLGALLSTHLLAKTATCVLTTPDWTGNIGTSPPFRAAHIIGYGGSARNGLTRKELML